MPLLPEEKWRLSDLAILIGDGVSLILRYNAETAKFEAYTSNMSEYSPINAVISDQEGYIVMMTKEAKVTFSGKPWTDESSISPIPAFWGKPGVSPSRKAWLNLERLLLEMGAFGPPKNSSLLQNYPNPFNPETWIPFELAKESEVTIRIYNIKGQLIRTVNLGTKSAGIYTRKNKAAYWNGRNELGEFVTSGVYYYTIQTGDFTSARKMLLMK